MVKIYVAIASYRDRYLQSTIDSAISNARYPKNLTFGCFIQKLPQDIDVEISNDYNGQVLTEISYAGKLFSVTKCRNLALQWLTTDYDYVLQIDSHTKFTKDWDAFLVQWHEDLPEKSVFSTYLPRWFPKKDFSFNMDTDNPSIYYLPNLNTSDAKSIFMDTYDIVPILEPHHKNPDSAIKTWYLCGHFIFAPAAYFLKVAQPAWIVFWGEELYHSLIAASYGWSVYTPPQRILWHLYPQDNQENLLPKIWDDFPDKWTELHDAATDKIIDAITLEAQGPEHLGDIQLVKNLYKELGYDIGELLSRWRDERKAIY